MIIDFLIQGTSKNPYKVTFQKNNEHVYAGCDCRSRKGGLCCKHIMSVLDADVTNMVKGSSNEINDVLQLIAGTRFSEIYNDYKAGFKLYNSKILTEMKKAMVTKPVL